jgi:hypothetical protein
MVLFVSAGFSRAASSGFASPQAHDALACIDPQRFQSRAFLRVVLYIADKPSGRKPTGYKTI